MKLIHLTPTAWVFLQFGALAVGMASWLDDDEEESGGSEGDDEFAMEDDDDFDDDFDEEFGSFDDMDGGGGAAAGQDSSVNELEHRIEELETEVSNVASKANTVRSENEQISESVEDVEENVRKLLEIYEMVTRGVNPFVDDVETEAMGGGGAESFGLFDEEEAEDTGGDEDLDPDIADADADDFFEDDAFDEEEALDDEFDDGFDEDLDEEFDEGDGLDDEFEDADALDDEFEDADDDMDGFDDFEEDDAEEDAEDGGGGGTSFEELKEEYESGDADWAEGEEPAGEADEAVAAEAEAESSADESAGEELGFDDSDLEAADEADDAATEAETTEEPAGDSGLDESTGAPPSIGLRTRGEGPHLAEPPKGYLADVVSLEWLDYLLSEFGPKNTVRTLNYYERIGWIGEPVRDQLFDYLEGLTDSDYLYREEFGTTELTMDDHLESLEYIEELASEDIERAIVDRTEELHRNGIQR